MGNKNLEIYYRLSIDRIAITDTGYSVFRATLYRDHIGMETTGKFLNDLQTSVYYVTKDLWADIRTRSCNLGASEFVPYFLTRHNSELHHRFCIGNIVGCQKADDYVRNRFTRGVYIRLARKDTSIEMDKYVNLASLGAIKRMLPKCRFTEDLEAVDAIKMIVDKLLKSEVRAKNKRDKLLIVADLYRMSVEAAIRTYNHQAPLDAQINVKDPSVWITHRHPEVGLVLHDENMGVRVNIMPALTPKCAVQLYHNDLSCNFHCSPEEDEAIVSYLNAVRYLNAAIKLTKTR